MSPNYKTAKKPNGEKQSEIVSVRLKKKERATAGKLARKEGMSLGAWFFEGRRKEIESAP